MSWLTLTVTVAATQAEILSEALLEQGALSVEIHDADADTPHEHAMYGEPGEPAAELWPSNHVTAMFAQDAPIDTIMREAALAVGLHPPPEYRTAILPDNDWVRLTQAQFEPIQISQRLWIVPTWHTASDPNAINITLDPGLAFGSGSHPTTRLCLRWLDGNLQGGEQVLDYGCGSGILTIAALKLGASSAVGVDVDAQAIQASRDNATANQVAAHFYLPDEAPAQQVDIVIANILTNPLKVLAPLLARATRPGGKIVLSGILEKQAQDVQDIYAQWFKFLPPNSDEGWVCLAGVKLPRAGGLPSEERYT